MGPGGWLNKLDSRELRGTGWLALPELDVQALHELWRSRTALGLWVPFSRRAVLGLTALVLSFLSSTSCPLCPWPTVVASALSPGVQLEASGLLRWSVSCPFDPWGHGGVSFSAF